MTFTEGRDLEALISGAKIDGIGLGISARTPLPEASSPGGVSSGAAAPQCSQGHAPSRCSPHLAGARGGAHRVVAGAFFGARSSPSAPAPVSSTGAELSGQLNASPRRLHSGPAPFLATGLHGSLCAHA